MYKCWQRTWGGGYTVSMALEPEHLEHMLQEQEGPHLMTKSAICDECGYQLRGLPFVGCCPECDSCYSVRGIKTEGIFVPHAAKFPAMDLAAGLAGGALALWLVAGLVRRFDLWCLLFAGILGYMGFVFLRQGLRRLGLFIRGQKIASQADSEDDV
ncbi:MAG: hypothetical protein O7D91_13950 [Planctomycetota bacterium]|nr:hypothetical protein [Planctomycetota bacterium]